MCGIAGFVGEGDRHDLRAMTAALAHRGPDGDGFFADPELRTYLGHRRLAIIDIAGGQQPMWNEDGTVGVVFNGEIYNHVELRAELQRLGHVFRSSHSDTEVLVHGYEEWGSELPVRLNGMFAFAAFDRPRHRLFLARDRFGEKPLYFARRPGFFGFASELSALIRHSRIPARPSIRSLQKFFAYGYWPAPACLYEGCAKLPAGHHATYDIDGDRFAAACYWRFRLEPDEALGERDEPRLVEELRALLATAVQRRLVSDVPLGLFLSGGIDSSAILSFAADHRPGPSIDTFTIGFDEPSFDESRHAQSVAEFHGTRHHAEQLDLGAARALVPDVLGRLDEPLGDASLLPTYLLSRFTRQRVAVALSGDGGDELFAGYDPFQALAPARLYAAGVPPGIHAGIRRLADLLPISGGNMSLDFKLRRTLMGLSYPEAIWNPVWMSPLEPSAIAEVFYQPLNWQDLYGEAITLWEGSAGADPVDRTLEFFTHLYLPDDILAKVDRAAMMVALEARAVFLDNDLVEFCRRLPNRFKFRRGQRKYLLKKALEGRLPPSILVRRKKGFGIPLSRWLRHMAPALPPWTPAGMRPEPVEAFWRAHCDGRRDHRLFLWCWLSLQHCLAPPPAMAQRGAA